MGMKEAGPATMTSRAKAKTKYWRWGSRKVEVLGELKGRSGGTCHNDKPGRNDGYGGSRYDDGGVRQQRHHFQTRMRTRNWRHTCTSNLTPSPQTPIYGSWDDGPFGSGSSSRHPYSSNEMDNSHPCISALQTASTPAFQMETFSPNTQRLNPSCQQPRVLANGQDLTMLQKLRLRKLLPQAHTLLFWLT